MGRQGFAILLAAALLTCAAGCAKEQPSMEEAADTSFSAEMEMEAPRDDFLEVRPEGDRAQVLNPMSGGADEEAESLRETIVQAADDLTVTGTSYYISPDGDDINDGLTPETAFRTLDVLKWLELAEGDAVLLERGSVFRITDPITPVSGVSYGAYGTGEKPCIYGSPKNYGDASHWEPSNKAHVWKLNFAYGDVGSVVFNHGEAVGIKKNMGLNQLNETGDFYHNINDGILYLYCSEGNPGNCYSDIEVCPHFSIVYLDTGVGNVTIDNWCLKYSGAFGINAVWANNGVTITNCEIGYIGGSMLDLSIRYGNGIQFWCGTQDTVVENCWIYQNFDTAITFQGSAEDIYRNISFSNNLLEFNDMDIEIWDNGENFVIEDLRLDHNIMRFTAKGWGTRISDAGNRGGAAGFRIKLSNCKGCTLSAKDNIFDCPAYAALSWVTPTAGPYTADIEGNVLYANGDRMVENILAYGPMNDGQQPEVAKASNQAELEAAMKRFDPKAAKVQWLE